MSETIYKNGMTRNYQNYMNQLKRQTAIRAQAGTKTGESFLDTVNKYAGKITISEVDRTEQISTKDMTMEKYKEYISDRLSRIPMHPSQMQNSVAIHISDAGFEAMKNDPEYEEWVMEWLGKDFAFHDPWSGICGGHYVVHYIGATKEEYRGEGWYPAYQNGSGESLFNQKAKGSFWERRLKRQEMERQIEKNVQTRKAWLKSIQTRMIQKQLPGLDSSFLQLQMTQGIQVPLSQLIWGGMGNSDVNV